DGAVEGVAKRRVLLVDPPQRLLQELAVRHGDVAFDELAQLDGHALVRHEVDASPEHQAIRRRRQRQTLVVVGEEKTVGVEAEPDLPRLQRVAVRAPEDRKKYLV